MREKAVLLRAERLILSKRRKDDSTRKMYRKGS